jgi:hypothetical protein
LKAAALDRIHDKFGSAALTTADLHETPTKRAGIDDDPFSLPRCAELAMPD